MMLPRAGASECSACPAGTSKGAGDGPCEPCDDGEYAPVDGSSSCRTCSWPLATLKNSSSTSCDACVENYYWSAADDAVCTEEQCPEFCSACKDGHDCSDPGLTIASLKLEVGYWRASTASATVYACPWEDNCGGGAGVDGDALCRRHSEGPLLRF